MKMTDGKRTVEITIRELIGNSWGPDFSNEYFNAGSLPVDTESGAYIVDDVDYCIDYANSDNPEEGACFTTDENGEPVRNANISVFVVDL